MQNEEEGKRVFVFLSLFSSFSLYLVSSEEGALDFRTAKRNELQM